MTRLAPLEKATLQAFAMFLTVGCGPAQSTRRDVVVEVPRHASEAPHPSANETIIVDDSPPRAPPDDAIAKVRDPRLGRPPRSKALLATEATQLEVLLKVTPTNAPDRQAVLRRLAEAYVELGRVGGPSERAARAKAIDAYSTWLKENPSAPRKDEVLYYLALEQERVGNTPDAMRGLHALVTDLPDSSWARGAYLAFGERFFAQVSQGRADLDAGVIALEAYRKVGEKSSPPQRWVGLALVRTAQLHGALGHADEAAAARATARAYLTEHADQPEAAPLLSLLDETKR